MARSRARAPSHLPCLACLGLSQLAKSAWQATAAVGDGRRSAVRPLAGAKQKSNVMFMSCYLILRVLLYSAARFISFHLLFAFFFSLFLFFFGAFCVSVFICLEIFHLHWHRAPCSDKLQQQDELTQSPLEVPPPPPTSSLGLAPTRRFMTFTFMTGICVCLCACVCVCPFSCMQAWKAAEILICYFIAYTQRVLRCMIYGLWLTRALLIATE